MSGMTDTDRRYVKMQARILDLEREVALLRQLSSAGFARGSIKQAPRLVWPIKPELGDEL